ncbi:MAG: class I SAM-dependent methyltransferase [Clostridia bacterium]|nr:class I SAM-dependent methyltransferase [Clostridia bacterium]
MKLSELFRKKTKTSTNPVVDFYNNYDEEGRLLRKSRRPEYLTTMKYIDKYLFPGAKIIEIGAGTGRYSVALAEKGYDVTAVELVEHNIDIMKKKVKPLYNITICQGNACDMSCFADESFDIVLLLGPMYHLFTDEDKHKALDEAIRIAKKGGIIFASYCNNDTTIYKFFYTNRILPYIDKGMIKEDYHTVSSPAEIFELYRKSDIDKLMQNKKVSRLHFVGVDMLSYLFDDRFDQLGDREFEEYMKFLSVLCEREDCTGLSIHMLDIFRKDIQENGFAVTRRPFSIRPSPST